MQKRTTARQMAEARSGFRLPQGVIDAEARAAQPHRFATPIVQEAPARTLMPQVVAFPVQLDHEPTYRYERVAKDSMRAFVAAVLNGSRITDDRIAWRMVSDRAVAEVRRPLSIDEGVLLTWAVRDVLNAQDRILAHRPGRVFDR